MKTARLALALVIASVSAGSLLAGDKPATAEKPACCSEAEKAGKKCEKCAAAAKDAKGEKPACCTEAAKAGKECEHCKKK